jgi:hypothetical protein
MITGFQAMFGLWAWVGVVALYATFRAAVGPETDPIRESGPIGSVGR